MSAESGTKLARWGYNDDKLDTIKPLGRPKGSYGVSKLDQHEDEILKLLSHGVAKAAIARMYGSSWQTVHAWVRRRHAT